MAAFGPDAQRSEDDAPAPAPATRRALVRRGGGLGGWLTDSRNVVLLVLGAAFVIGGGRRLLANLRSRGAIRRLADPDVTADELLDAAKFGRDAASELARLQASAKPAEIRDAAGRALAKLWAENELVAEEEKAIVVRGAEIEWIGRRRYPRLLQKPIRLAATYRLPFLSEDTIAPAAIQWSTRVVGADRASLETYSPWHSGPGRVDVEIDPRGKADSGPHRVALQAKVRTNGLSTNWEVELPERPFAFELDPRLNVGALFANEDADDAAQIKCRVQLRTSEAMPAEPRFVVLPNGLVLRDPPELCVTQPIDCDLAHAMFLEFDGRDGRVPCGEVLLPGSGSVRETEETARTVRIPVAAIQGALPPGIDAPGDYRVRAVLVADPELGWSDPNARAIWPGTIVTDWVSVRIMLA